MTPPLRVAAHPVPDDTDEQPYTTLLYRAVRALGVEVTDFATTSVLRRPPDIVHWHWPDHLLLRRSWRRYVRPLQWLARLDLARWRGARFVYTAHNAAPHDMVLDRFGQWFLDAVDKRVDLALTLTEAGWDEVVTARPGLAGAMVRHTRHGEFASAYPPPPPTAAARERFGIDPSRPTVVFTGAVRTYKGVPSLVAAMAGVDADLLIAGKCDDPGLERVLRTAADADPRIHLALRFLDAADLVAAVAAASVVALPYRKILNSGAAFLALALDRPVLVPDLPTFVELEHELGTAWIHRIVGDEVRPDDLRAALDQQVTGSPDLSAYRWPVVAAETVAAYEDVRRA